MKKAVLLLFVLIASVACNEKGHGDANLHISGTVKGLKQGKLYIQKLKDTAMVTLDTIVIKGKSDFESHIKLESPQMLYLVIDRGSTNSVDDNLPFFAEPGKMTIITTNDRFYAGARVTGSENHKLYEDFVKIKGRFTCQRLDLIELSAKATTESNVAQLDSIRQQIDKLNDKRYLYTAQYALNNSKHEIAPYLAYYEISDINFKYLDTINKSMSPDVAKSHYGKMLKQLVEERKRHQAELAKQ